MSPETNTMNRTETRPQVEAPAKSATMRPEHWLMVMAGLVAWCALVVLWTTGPHDCTPPDPTTGRVTCQ